MAEYNQFERIPSVEIPLNRYDELIRAEHRLNLLQNALEDMYGYESVQGLKRNFGIPERVSLNKVSLGEEVATNE